MVNQRFIVSIFLWSLSVLPNALFQRSIWMFDQFIPFDEENGPKRISVRFSSSSSRFVDNRPSRTAKERNREQTVKMIDPTSSLVLFVLVFFFQSAILHFDNELFSSISFYIVTKSEKKSFFLFRSVLDILKEESFLHSSVCVSDTSKFSHRNNRNL